MRGGGRGGPPVGSRGDFRGGMGGAAFMPSDNSNPVVQGFTPNNEME